jgi:4-hydroxybenzoate polyprenyltransferase
MNNKLLYLSSFLIFIGSFCNELLLDIYDYHGDKINKIYTLPVLFGIENTWFFIYNIYIHSVIFSSLYLKEMYNNIFLGCILFLSNIPQIINLKNICIFNFNQKLIKYTVNESSKTLFAILLYFCFLTKIRFY